MGVDLLNVRGLKELEHQGPIVMVNLMRFRERSLDGAGSGWDAYLRYSALTVPMIKARGGTLLWTGDAKAVALGAQGGSVIGDPHRLRIGHDRLLGRERAGGLQVGLGI